mmetsp:Transcript_26753/g.63807  ORF Transcript_26753/g.63807 Transcript_26753/m.63807 type:complete len:169 (-) Transcript_26753:67-573(-)
MAMVENETPQRHLRRREVGITATYCICDNNATNESHNSSSGIEGGAQQDDDTPPPSAAASTSVSYFDSNGTTTTTTTNGDQETVEGETKNERLRFGLPVGVDADKPGKPEPGDVSYSGMHDQGPLPRLNEERGPMYVLLNATRAAKTFNDQFMTEMIQKEKEKKNQKT